MQILRVQKLSPSELKQVVDLHYHILEESFLNNFGQEFLTIAYETIAQSPNNIVYLARERKQVRGFLVATLDHDKFNKEIINKDFFQLSWLILKTSIKQPILFFRLASWLLNPFQNSLMPSELQFIAVDATYQGHGLGTKLLKRLEKDFKKAGVSQYRVGTKAINKSSNRFYLKNGFKFIKARSFFGSKFNYYSSIKLLPKQKMKIKNNFYYRWSLIIISLFLLIFIFKSFMTMIFVPFYDFDEAHRAENVKQMAAYQSYFVPLTGSSFDRVSTLNIPIKNDPVHHLYYHLERPFLVYLTMVLSTTIFGSIEWAYRLPSFLFGLAMIFSFPWLAKKLSTHSFSFFALAIAYISLICSSDLWLSSQYAQMDTGISLFLYLSLVFLILFAESKQNFQLIISGLCLGLGVLTKGQPVVIILFPLIFLFLAKKITWKNLIIFGIATFSLVGPWIVYLASRFGLVNLITIFSGFALTSASIIDEHQKAPFFWYVRWWWESLRPGWTIFLSLFLYDLINHKIDWKRGTLLSYILGGLLAFSIPINKIWWYVLPLIPALALYIYLSALDYLQKRPKRLPNLLLTVAMAGLPILFSQTNTITLIYGLAITLTTLLILSWPEQSIINSKFNSIIWSKLERIKKPQLFNQKSYPWLNLKDNFLSLIFVVILFGNLFAFVFRFPEIIPYHWNTKPVAIYYKNLPGMKCLWIYDMPAESALFYSDAGEVETYDPNRAPYGHCQNYVMTPEKIPVTLRNKQIVFRQGRMKLIKL